jgi:hypothetical protein
LSPNQTQPAGSAFQQERNKSPSNSVSSDNKGKQPAAPASAALEEEFDADQLLEGLDNAEVDDWML